MTGNGPQGPRKNPEEGTLSLAGIEARLKSYVPPAESGDYALNPDLKDRQPPGFDRSHQPIRQLSKDRPRRIARVPDQFFGPGHLFGADDVI